MSDCGGNLDLICSGPGLFTGVGDIGSEELKPFRNRRYGGQLICYVENVPRVKLEQSQEGFQFRLITWCRCISDSSYFVLCGM